MLPFDVARCDPFYKDAYCRNCKRWSDHPNQTWGDRTPQSSVDSSSDEGCRYIPIKEISEMR